LPTSGQGHFGRKRLRIRTQRWRLGVGDDFKIAHYRIVKQSASLEKSAKLLSSKKRQIFID